MFIKRKVIQDVYIYRNAISIEIKIVIYTFSLRILKEQYDHLQGEINFQDIKLFKIQTMMSTGWISMYKLLLCMQIVVFENNRVFVFNAYLFKKCGSMC